MSNESRYLQSSCPVADCEVRQELKKIAEQKERLIKEKDKLQLEHEEMVELLRGEEPEGEQQKKIQNLIVDKETLKKQLARFQEKIKEKDYRIQELEAQIEEKEAAYNELYRHMREFKSQYEMDSQIRKTRAKQVELDKQIIKAEEELKIVNNNLEMAQAKLENVKKYHDSLIDQIEIKQKSINELIKQYKRMAKEAKDYKRLRKFSAKPKVPSRIKRIFCSKWFWALIIAGLMLVAGVYMLLMFY